MKQLIYNDNIFKNNEDINDVKMLSIINTYRLVMLFGDVQSGKTNYIIDNVITPVIKSKKYRFIIYITGNLNKLHHQNVNRIHEQDEDFEEFIKKHKWYRSNLTNKEIHFNGSNKLIYIKNTRKDLDSLRTLNRINDNILIIIDECDYGTIKKNSEICEINKKLAYLYNKNKNINFFLLSATPYRNLKVDNKDMIPQYIIYKDNYSKYCGLNIFHNDNNEKNKYIIPIDKWDGIEYIENFIYRYLVNTIRMKRNFNNNWRLTKMIFNCTVKNKIHIEIKKNIKIILNKIRETSATGIIKLNNILDEYKIVKSDQHSYIEEISDLVDEILDENSVVILNQKSSKYANFDDEDDKNIIIIGGNLLGRGITFNNLITTVMTNETKSTRESTLLQRARWFGDRYDYLDYINIFLTKECSKRYLAIKEINSFSKKLIKQNNSEFNQEIKKEIDKKWCQILRSKELTVKKDNEIE